MPFDEEELDPHGECAAEIERLRKDKALLIELVLEDGLTAAAKNLIAIALRDGGLAPTAETLAWAKSVRERIEQHDHASL